MQFTKSYLKHFVAILTIVGAGVGVLSIVPSPLYGRNMVGYYCAPGSLFLWMDLSKNFYCGWIVYVVHIFGLMLFVWCLVLLVDLFKWCFQRIKHLIKRSLIDIRNATIVIVSVSRENEHFIAVYNGEFCLHADKVSVSTSFIFGNIKYDDLFKWIKNNSEDNDTSIPRKSNRLFHFATTTKDKLIIHMAHGDETFPLPSLQNSPDLYYVFPVTIFGEMSFLGFKIKNVNFIKGEDVIVTHDRKVEIRRYT
jgi:hypothetical protein